MPTIRPKKWALDFGTAGTLEGVRTRAAKLFSLTDEMLRDLINDVTNAVSDLQRTAITIVFPLPPTQGGTGVSSVSVGDLLYGSAVNAWARLAKSPTATRYLANTGVGNIPKWDQVNLPDGVKGDLPIVNLAGGVSASATTFLRGDNTWAVPASGGGSGGEPLTNGDPINPELIFDSLGDVIMVI